MYRFKLPARKLVELATIEGAKALGIADRTVALKKGKRADVEIADKLNGQVNAILADPQGEGPHCVELGCHTVRRLASSSATILQVHRRSIPRS